MCCGVRQVPPGTARALSGQGCSHTPTPTPAGPGLAAQPGPRLGLSPGHPSFRAPQGAGLALCFAGVGGVLRSPREHVGGASASTKRFCAQPGSAIRRAGRRGVASPLPGSTEPRGGNPVPLVSSCPRGPQTRATWESTSGSPGCWGRPGPWGADPHTGLGAGSASTGDFSCQDWGLGVPWHGGLEQPLADHGQDPPHSRGGQRPLAVGGQTSFLQGQVAAEEPGDTGRPQGPMVGLSAQLPGLDDGRTCSWRQSWTEERARDATGPFRSGVGLGHGVGAERPRP